MSTPAPSMSRNGRIRKVNPDGTVELASEYVDSLTLGVHRVRVTYTDGSSVTVEFEVVDSTTRPGGHVVKTGDKADMRVTWTALALIIAGLGVVVTLVLKRKKEHHES